MSDLSTQRNEQVVKMGRESEEPKMKVENSDEKNAPNNSSQKDQSSEVTTDKEAMEKCKKDKLLAKYSDHFYVDDFIKKCKAEKLSNIKPISTGFLTLDSILDGGLYEDSLYIIGSISSLGKTTFALQMAYSVAEQNNVALIFSLEMARTELMAKSISRLSFLKSNGKDAISGTTREIMTYNYKTQKIGNEFVNLEESMQITKKMNFGQSIIDYYKNARNIIVYESSGSTTVDMITDEIKKYVAIGIKPVVFIDYLQLIAATDGRKSDKQTLDETVMLLKQLARKYKLSIVGLSSFNRDSYSKPVSMTSFKESGAIEFSADVLIGMQLTGIEEHAKKFKGKVEMESFDFDKEKSKNPRKIDLKILKNRNGETGGITKYDFYCTYNYFNESN